MDAERLEKRGRIADLGVAIYPDKYLQRISTDELKAKDVSFERDWNDIMENTQETFRLAGRLMLKRVMGKLCFASIQDFHGRMQICFKDGFTKIAGLDEEKMSSRKFWEKLIDLGDHVGVEGEIFRTKHDEKTLLIKELTFLGKALRPMPEKFQGVADDEIKLRQRYLETLSDESARKRFKVRSDVIRVVREFMWSHDFMEVETPMLEHEATGAAAQPYHTHNNALDIDLVLRISHELPHKKLIVGGYEKVFEIGKVFRNEGIDPSHLPEHTHFEWYAAYWSFEENMQFMEELYKHIFTSLKIDPKIEVKDKQGDMKIVDFGQTWERIDYVDLLKQDSGIDITVVTTQEELLKKIKEQDIHIDGMNDMGYATLVDYLYKKVSRPQILGPAFLYNYPKSMKPLARSNDENPDMTDAFQLVVNGWELCNAFSELVDPIEQDLRFKEQAVGVAAGDEEAFRGDDEYILAMEYGLPPTSGVGPGLDRFIALITGQDNLRDIVFFPLMRPRG